MTFSAASQLYLLSSAFMLFSASLLAFSNRCCLCSAFFNCNKAR